MFQHGLPITLKSEHQSIMHSPHSQLSSEPYCQQSVKTANVHVLGVLYKRRTSTNLGAQAIKELGRQENDVTMIGDETSSKNVDIIFTTWDMLSLVHLSRSYWIHSH